MRRRVLQWALALGAVALAIVLTFSYVLQQRATPSPRQTPTLPMLSPAPSPTPTTWVQPTLGPLPPGWTHILSGYGFTEGGGSSKMVVSAARPGRIAGCALPSTGYEATPHFVLSDDGGRTWLTLPIPILGPVLDCVVLADTRRPDTLAIGATTRSERSAVITFDAGRTWRAVSAPPQGQPWISDGPGFGGDILSDGRLITTLFTSQDGRQRLAETTVDEVGAEWKMLDNHIPFSANNLCKCVTAFAVDYANPARIYVAIYADQLDLKSGITAYATSNSGASWTAVRNWAGSQRLALWTTLNGNVYVWDERYSGAEAEPLYLSTNRGASWTDLKLPASLSARVFVGVSGRKVVAAVHTDIYLFDTATGAFSLIGQLPNLWYGVGVSELLAVVVEGPSPTFIAASTVETALMSLS